MAAAPEPQPRIGMLEQELVIDWLVANGNTYNFQRLTPYMTISGTGYISDIDIKTHSDIEEADLITLVNEVTAAQSLDTSFTSKNATSDKSTVSVDTLNAQRNTYYNLDYTDENGDPAVLDLYGDNPLVGGAQGSDKTEDDSFDDAWIGPATVYYEVWGIINGDDSGRASGNSISYTDQNGNAQTLNIGDGGSEGMVYSLTSYAIPTVTGDPYEMRRIFKGSKEEFDTFVATYAGTGLNGTAIWTAGESEATVQAEYDAA